MMNNLNEFKYTNVQAVADIDSKKVANTLADELKLVKAMLKDLTENLDSASLLSKELWTCDDIAKYCSIGKSSAYKITLQSRFPRSVRMQTSDTGYGAKRWVAQEVKEYVKRYREPSK